MTLFDDNPHDSNEQPPAEPGASVPAVPEPASSVLPHPVSGRPHYYAASAPPRYTPRAVIRRPAHFLVLAALRCLHFFRALQLLLVQTALILYFAPHRSLLPKNRGYLLSKPQFLFGTSPLVCRHLFYFST